MAAADMSPFLSPLPSDEELDDDCDDQSPKTYLQKVLSERNNLRAQNSQLWKIIQKQRIIIQQLQKTLSGRDSKSPVEESDLSVSQPSPPRKSKYPQETSEENSSRSENNPQSTLEEPESPPKRSVEKECPEKPSKGRRGSTTIQRLEGTQVELKADGSTAKEDKPFKRRSKTLSAAFRETAASEKPPDSKKSSKENKKRRSKEINAALKDSLDAVQAENLVIEDSPAPENAIKTRVVEYKVKKIDHGTKKGKDSKSSRKKSDKENKNTADGDEKASRGESSKKAPKHDTDQSGCIEQESNEDGLCLLPSKNFEDPPKPIENAAAVLSSDDGSVESKEMPETSSKDSRKASKKSTESQRRANLPGGGTLTCLDNIFVHVVGCTVKVNSKGKEVLIFRMQISQSEVAEDSSTIGNSRQQHLWTVEKYFPDLLELDNQLRSTGQNAKNSSVKLPEKKAWNTSSPSKIDQRKLMLQNYLQLAINSSPVCPSVISEFISTGQVDEAEPNKPAGEKEGYLSKRGKNFGKWKRRYFSLNNSILEYFESKNGTKLGDIHLAYAQVAVQQTSSLEYDPENSTDTFRHAFMILEPKRGTQGTLRHVLCADSDAERDEWVNAIGYHFMGDLQPPPPPIPEAEADSQLSSDHSLSPTTQDPPITDKDESIGIINNQSTTSIGSISSANSDSRPSEIGQLPLPNRTVPKPEGSAVINIPNAMPKILKEGPPKPARKTFWGKRIFSGDSAKNKPPQQPVFGVPLHQSVQASRVLEGYALSSVVYRCIQYLDSKQAQFEEGIYRLSGSSATIRMLRTKFDTEGDYGLVDSGVYYDVHAISGLLKLYLRELPSTVLTAELHRDFLQITELPSRRLRVRKLGRLICSLPIENYTLLRALIGHLIVVVQEADTNKMPLKNIVIVFAPTLGIPAGVFSLLLSEFKYVFYIDPEGTAIPQELSGEEDTPPPTPVTQEAAPSELNERDARRARHRHTASADTVMELAKGVTLLLGESQDSGPEEDGLAPDPNESRRSKRNSVIYRNRAPPEIVRLERQAEESLTNKEELNDDLVLES